ncbi:MAG: PIN domain-containing protein [Chitinophagaceae bacterium]|nr:PIN domain-containing protein [Chitinophagaceae bacterium]
MKNLFLDTNIVIDVLANRLPFSTIGARLFDFAEKGKINLFISALSYSNIYYILKKSCTHKEMISLLKDLEALTTTMDVTGRIISNALYSEFKDFEDAIQSFTAYSYKKMDAIVTRDVKDYKTSQLPVFTPNEVIIMLENDLA